MNYSTDLEIIKILKIPERTFYRYKSKIYRDYAERFYLKRFDDTAIYTEQLRNRLVKYLKHFESKLDSCNSRDLPAVGELIVSTAKTIFELDMQSFEALGMVRSLDNRVKKYEITNNSNEDDKTKELLLPEPKED